MARPLFILDERLSACADFVRGGSRIADIGTDHAYLPIWLVRMGKIPSAVAADIREGPLRSAQENINKYEVSGQIAVRKSDGLQAVQPQEADDIVIAGMGGELILRIVLETEWLYRKDKHLILQPMTAAPELRMGLTAHGFRIQGEKAVVLNKVYSVLSVNYIGTKEHKDDLFAYMGELKPGSEGAGAYAAKVISGLQKKATGIREIQPEYAEELMETIRKIERKYCG